jgi:hypothetical protein
MAYLKVLSNIPTFPWKDHYHSNVPDLSERTHPLQLDWS